MLLKQRENVFTSSIGVMRKQDQLHDDAAALIAKARQAAIDARTAGTNNIRYFGEDAPQPMPVSIRDSLRKLAQRSSIMPLKG